MGFRSRRLRRDRIHDLNGRSVLHQRKQVFGGFGQYLRDDGGQREKLQVRERLYDLGAVVVQADNGCVEEGLGICGRRRLQKFNLLYRTREHV
jgi:hypothetical protein